MFPLESSAEIVITTEKQITLRFTKGIFLLLQC